MVGQKHIALALSGGGVRAAAFHAGILRWLAEKRQLDAIHHISSVSGGSLFVGLVFHLSEYTWPSSDKFLDKVFPSIRETLISTSLQKDAAIRLVLFPQNWRFFLSRANIIAQSIRNLWGITRALSDLPENPVWSINGTTAENGRRFRFKGTKLGDYEIGYAEAPDFPLANAMAISAAFPGGIGPLRVDCKSLEWEKRKSWNWSAALEKIEPPYSRIHVYDGGVYDNLGLEPFFDNGKQSIKIETGGPPVDFVIVSDAGAVFGRQQIPGPLHPGRLKRVASIGFDQARALRVRSFVNYLQRNPTSGMYLQIGTDPVESMRMYGVETLPTSNNWLEKAAIESASNYKTSLCKMNAEDFDLISRHGYETAAWNARTFSSFT